MEIKGRLFPYPVLCGDSDDYKTNTEFILEPKITENVHELLLEYNYTVNCNSLETELRKGTAEYVLHIECAHTSFRIALSSKVPEIKYHLPKSRVNGEIRLVAMIVARVDIKNYDTSELNDDYTGENITFKKGSILAYQNLPSIYVTKKTDDLANNESFFSVIKQTSLDPNEVKSLEFLLNKDKIQVLVDEKTYEAFIRYQHTRSVAMSMLLLPALTYMITEVRDNPDGYMKYQWYQRLDRFYRAQGKDFVSDYLQREENPVMIAQEMLQNPVSKAYRELYALEGTE